MTQLVASHGLGMSVSAGMCMGMGGSSELTGVLGDTYAVYNSFPGLYHPDYLSQNWVQPGIASVQVGPSVNDHVLLFAGVNSRIWCLRLAGPRRIMVMPATTIRRTPLT